MKTLQPLYLRHNCAHLEHFRASGAQIWVHPKRLTANEGENDGQIDQAKTVISGPRQITNTP